jgi:diketogulonate reductase-like aldo/keto reductase
LSSRFVIAPVEMRSPSHNDPCDRFPVWSAQRTLNSSLVSSTRLRLLVSLASELGCTLPQLAIAFPITHPAVTSVIIGPRTMEQLDQLLAGAALTLDEHTLDRIDEIVALGTDHYNATWRPPELDDPAARRRPPTDRAATD